MGRAEFEEWSNRIISGALVKYGESSDVSYEAFIDSQKCILAGMILHLGPTECHKPDAFFIHSLRKAACNEVAHAIGMELRQKAKDRLAEQEAAMLAGKGSDEEE